MIFKINHIIYVNSIIFAIVLINISICGQIIASNESLSVTIKLNHQSIVYEGDIIDCEINGEVDVKYWCINNQSHHTTFKNDNPIIFDPEPTPLNAKYVNLTVYVGNKKEMVSDTVQIILKKIYFGDIHWHTELSDGKYTLEEMYKNAIDDNYLDFAACTDHGFMVPMFQTLPLYKLFKNIILGKDPWQIIKNKNNIYNTPGSFTTLLGFEWSASNFFPGGKQGSLYGYNDVSHINFYYKDVYPNASKYSPLNVHTYDDIFKRMSEEYNRGHLNIGFMHHPIGKMYLINIGDKLLFPLYYNVNWSFLVRELKNTEDRDKILRGVEVYSKWGTSIGQYSNISIEWPYLQDNSYNRVCLVNDSNSWVENALWEYSNEFMINKKFTMIASSDTHSVNRPGSANLELGNNPSGIIAAFTVHNTRDEIWDAINNCSVYGIQLLKIRANVYFNDQMAIGKWINCTSPINITISTMSTFTGNDHSRKNMCPHGYLSDELDYPITDIFIVKNDRDKGRPWCKVIKHLEPNNKLVVASFEDYEAQPNDFYYILINQNGQSLNGDLNSMNSTNKYTSFIGPIFIK